MAAYYNENDSYAAQWLRNLVRKNLIARGDVDERSIADVRPDDLRGYYQCHFFAGIGGWSYALRLAEWPDDRPVWTGSCPCQPFSAAGKGKAADDERHLWPVWFSLIRELRPAIIFGEQVEAAIGWGWLDAVFADLEAESYACGAAVLPACSVGAPHIRQRLWFMADADGRDASAEGLQRGGEYGQQPQDGRSVRMAYANLIGTESCVSEPGRPQSKEREGTSGCSILGGMGDASGEGPQERERDGRVQRKTVESPEGQTAVGGSNPWHPCDWLPCTDGKARPVEPGTFPLAHGIPSRVGLLRGYGNAINPEVAAEFIIAASEAGR